MEKIHTFDKYRPDQIGIINKGLSFGDMTDYAEGSTGLWDEEIKAFIESSNLKNLFFSEDWVFTILDLKAELVSSSPMVIKRITDVRDGKVIEETIDDHPAITLLEMPNPYQEYSTFIYNYVIEYDLMGNSLIFYARARQNLIIIPADSVSLRFDDKQKFAGYSVAASDSADVAEVRQMINDGMMMIKKENIWHQRRPNPASILWGLSPFVPNRKNILFNRYTQDWLNSFYLKGATPTMALSMDRNANDDAATRLLRSFEMAYTGRRNMRRPLLLPKGVTVDSISPTIADQQLIELVRANREQILNILRIPKHALSLAETGSLGSEEHKQALKFLWTASIIPTQVKIADHLTRKMKDVGLLEENERLEFDNSNVEVLREDLMSKAELSERMKSVFTINEIRERVWDAEPIDGGDKLADASHEQQPLFPFNFAHQEQPVVKAETQKVDTKFFYEDDLTPQSKEFRDKTLEMVYNKYASNIATRLKQNISIIENKTKGTAAFWEKAGASYMLEAQPIIVSELRKAPARKKALDDDESPSKIPSKKTLKKKLERLYDMETGEKTDVTDWSKESWLKTYVDDFSSVVDESYDVQVQTITDVDNQEAIDALKARTADGRRRILEERAIAAHKAIGETTIGRILDVVERGVSDRKTIQEIGKDISDYAGISKKRSELIARQEALTAVSIGKQAGLDDASKVLGKDNLVKVWVNLGDNRVRGNPGGLYPDSEADHWTLQGETREVDEPFSNDLMYPRDVKSRDLQEILGCRCDFLIVPKEDIEAFI